MLDSLRTADSAARNMNGRWFAGKMISVEFIPEGNYCRKFPDAH